MRIHFSYYQNRYINSDSVLFKLNGANTYHFNLTVGDLPSEAHCLTYTFPSIPVSASALVRALLCKIEAEGKFRRYHIMITNISKNSFSLYVDDLHYMQVYDAMNATLLAYLRENELRGLEFEVERK